MVTEKLCNNGIRAAGYPRGYGHRWARLRSRSLPTWWYSDCCCDRSVWYGYQQTQCTLCGALWYSTQHWVLLSRDWPCEPVMAYLLEAMMLFDPADMGWLRPWLCWMKKARKSRLRCTSWMRWVLLLETNLSSSGTLLNYFGEYREETVMATAISA